MYPTIEETYRERLKLLVKEYGSQAKLSEAIGKSTVQISQWLRGTLSKTGKPRSLKSDTAREIEKLTNKPHGWLDQPIYVENIKSTSDIHVGGGNSGIIGNDNTQNNNNFFHEHKTAEQAREVLNDKEATFLTALPIFGIDDAVKYVINPDLVSSSLSDGSCLSSFISYSDKTFSIRMQEEVEHITAAKLLQNDIVIVEPRIAPRDNDLVLVCVGYKTQNQRGLLARLKMDLAGGYSIKYNADEPVCLPSNAFICGVVVEVRRSILPSNLISSRIDKTWNVLSTLEK